MKLLAQDQVQWSCPDKDRALAKRIRILSEVLLKRVGGGVVHLQDVYKTSQGEKSQ